jgi:hypothetical protein
MMPCEHTCSGALVGTLQGTWSVLRNSTRSLEEEPRTVPSARTRPLRIITPALRTNAPAKGVSTRILSYPKLLQTSLLRVRSPLRRGSRAETSTPVRTTYQPPSDAPPGSEGSERANVLALHEYLSIQQCTSSNGEKGSENEKASH